MITTISKSFDFDAAHHLPNMPEGHKCKRVHGHTYRVEVRLRGQLDVKTGMVIDYGDIADAWYPVHAALDHQDLNALPDVLLAPALSWVRRSPISYALFDAMRANPTTENVAAFIATHFAEWVAEKRSVRFDLHSVRVYESSTTWAEVLW